REKSREMLQDAINNPATPEDGKVAAGNAINELASAIEKEGICEGALIAKGMSDAVVFISDGKVSVSVKSVNEPTAEEIVKIKDVIIGNTGITADNIKISSIE
ncbi:MAG: SpoIIIAH-like family protein, partial [Clostridia bacterium]|nr:SpoIIIAH-like family protein [Clostridia bacterium]